MRTRSIAILALLLCLFILLGSCTEGEAESSQGAESVDSVDSTESSEDSAVSEEDAALLEAARALLAMDGQVIDIFAKGALAPYADGLEEGDYGYLVSGNYYRVREESGYGTLDKIVALLDSVYTEESGIKEEYLTGYPRYGGPALRQDYLGNTEYCHGYISDFDTDTEGAALSLLEGKDGLYRLQYSKGGNIFVFEMADTDGGLRLCDSLLFISEAADRGRTDPDTITEDIGSASEMRGRCLWVNVFTDCVSSSWDEESRAAVKAMVSEAKEHLLFCAAEYGVDDLTVELSWTELDLDITPPDYLNGALWAIEAFETAVDGGYPKYAEELCKGDYDNVFINFHFNEHGRSFCLPCDSAVGEDSNYYFEHMVTYYSEQGEGTYFACASLYLHELLHAFGAVDLYDEWMTARGGDLAALYFDYDIMRREPWDIKDSYVSDLTAKLIGWSEGLEPQLRALFKEIRN